MSYITQCVAMWIANDSNIYHQAEALAIEALEQACDNESHAGSARSDAVDKLQSDIETLVCADMPSCKGIWGDLISCALQETDWEEIARDLLSDKEIWMVFSSDSEDAVLFTDKSAAIGFLEMKLDGDNTMHAAPFLRLASLDKGQTIDIEGTTYTLAVDL
jgi:hypothetical protein